MSAAGEDRIKLTVNMVAVGEFGDINLVFKATRIYRECQLFWAKLGIDINGRIRGLREDPDESHLVLHYWAGTGQDGPVRRW